MKKYNLKKRSFWATPMLIMAIFLMMPLQVLATNSDVTTQQKSIIESNYTYPVQPGTEEWEQLDHGERVLACQIPEEVMEQMTTEELATVVLEYPCFFDMIFYDSYQDGFEAVRDNFNGLQVLLKREDLAEGLLKIYRETDVKQMLSLNDEQIFDETLDLLYLETLIAQPEVRESASEEQLNEINSIAELNYSFQRDNQESIPSLSLSGYYESVEQQMSSTSTVRTPNGTVVPVIIRKGKDFSAVEKSMVRSRILSEFPGSRVVGDATIRYNCHAFAWANNRSVWMNDPSAYWNDGSYRLITSNSPSAVGQKAYYPGYQKEHSGNVIRMNGNQILSKWGPQCLVEHSVGNCPYSFVPLSVKFYGR